MMRRFMIRGPEAAPIVDRDRRHVNRSRQFLRNFCSQSRSAICPAPLLALFQFRRFESYLRG